MHNKTQIAGWTFKNLVVDIISDLYPKATSTFVPDKQQPCPNRNYTNFFLMNTAKAYFPNSFFIFSTPLYKIS